MMLLVALMGIYTSCSSASATNAGGETVEIKTSANCGACKMTIEKALKEVEGVKKARLDLGNKVAYVTYNPDKVSEDEIRKAIVNAGYDADDMECNKDAHDALPGCCQKGADPH